MKPVQNSVLRIVGLPWGYRRPVRSTAHGNRHAHHKQETAQTVRVIFATAEPPCLPSWVR
jgi:hypothetical protein